MDFEGFMLFIFLYAKASQVLKANTNSLLA